MIKGIAVICGFLLLLAIESNAIANQEARVIVKYKATAYVLKQAQSADRAASLSTRIGLTLRSGRSLDSQSEVLHATGISSADLASRLSTQADIEYAVPDRLRTIRSLPNDPLYAGQWHLQSTETAAIRANLAWDITTGSSNVVIAFVDTGVRYDHPDLATKLLPGYDFISDAPNAGDGNGRDADASDPGDYVSAADTSNAELTGLCGPLSQQSSSWHGTRVAGILSAASNNSIGIAGTSWGAKLLPVRVLGKCGGFDSDIIAGMRWAGGLSVPGVPDNPNPAKIINLSLGGSGFCSAPYSSAISDLASKGTLVVVAAGNESGAVDVPGNCPGVLAVAGVRNNGVKVGYSSFGPEVSISAPAGNCVNTSGACLYSIETTTNSGTTIPATNTYTDQYNHNVGTSFSAPQVAGVAALMLSVNPSLSPTDLISRIKNSARAFPTDPTLLACPSNPTSYANINQCNCTISTCGTGLLDAQAAVSAATPPSAVITALDALTANMLIRLDGSGSKPASGNTISTWHWQLVSSPAGASLTGYDTATTSLQATSAGTYVVSLTVTDNFGSTNTAQARLVVTPASTNTGAGSGSTNTGTSTSGGGGGGALDLYALFGLAGLIGLVSLAQCKPAQKAPAK
jgi:serine protease